jgi:L-2,4-diaminobutyrate decarboxylase
MGEDSATWLAGGRSGPDHLTALLPAALHGMTTGIAERNGPIPSGGPATVAAALATAFAPSAARASNSSAAVPAAISSDSGAPPHLGAGDTIGCAAKSLPTRGVGAERALELYAALLAAGSADPSDPACAAHLHCPPLAVSVAADVVASAMNPSMDSWDQAPMASELEAEFTSGIAQLCFPGAARADAVVTSGGTESNLLGLLLARETTGCAVRPICGANSHHSVARAAWLLGLPAPVVVPCADDRMIPSALAEALAPLGASAVVVATAGTTNTGRIDPLPEIAHLCRLAGARLHVDAAYGGLALCSRTLAPRLAGLDLADSVALDMHKFGWQPVAAGLLAARDSADLSALTVRAEYLNPDDDTEAGLPDLLGRSLRTSRRPDAFRMAVTVHALGTDGLGALVEHCCTTAAEVHGLVERHPDLRSWGPPELSTVVFRPRGADDDLVARVRRTLLEAGTAVIGRGVLPTGPDGTNQLWLKLTLLHPHTTADDYAALLERVAETAAAERSAPAPQSPVAS